MLFLNLKGCLLGNEGVANLSEGLAFNNSLLGLNLRANLFTSKGLNKLVQSLPISIKKLDIGENKIKDEGVTFLCEYVLSANKMVFNFSSEIDSMNEISEPNSPTYQNNAKEI